MKKKIAKKTHDRVYHSDDESEKKQRIKTMPKLNPIKKQNSDSEKSEEKSEIEVTPN